MKLYSFYFLQLLNENSLLVFHAESKNISEEIFIKPFLSLRVNDTHRKNFNICILVFKTESHTFKIYNKF